MNFMPPSGIPPLNNNYQRNRPYKPYERSPLLRDPVPNNYQNDAGGANSTPPLFGSPDFKAPIYNRIGPHRNIPNWNLNGNDVKRFNDGNKGEPFHSNNNNSNNRKRFNHNDHGQVPHKKKKWGPRVQNNSNSVQYRLDRFRNAGNPQVDRPLEVRAEEAKPPLTAPDITVHFVNDFQREATAPVVSSKPNPDNVFRIQLDAKTQQEIQSIQERSSNKEKQVIIPYAVTPSVTRLMMHERFSILSGL